MNVDKLFALAHEAGQAAVAGTVPVPMIVGSETELFSGKIDHSKPTYFVEGGCCGFAWVNIKPANSKFAKLLVAKGLARKDGYYGGVSYWISAFGQSLTRKEAYAYAFAGVLQEHGIKCYAMSRMD